MQPPPRCDMVTQNFAPPPPPPPYEDSPNVSDDLVEGCPFLSPPFKFYPSHPQVNIVQVFATLKFQTTIKGNF